MLKSGFSSSTFKYMSAEEIIHLSRESNISGIEWDGTHIPAGDLDKAERIGLLTRRAGVEIAGYTSEISVGMDARNFEQFKRVLSTAKALKAPMIRLYSSKIPSKYSNDDQMKKFYLESKIFAEFAKKENIIITLEFEESTITDTNQTTFEMMNKLNHPSIFLNWHPFYNMAIIERTEGLKLLLPYINVVRVFYNLGSITYPLINGYNEWVKYIDILKQANHHIYLLINRVKDNEVNQLQLDAKVLNDLIS